MVSSRLGWACACDWSNFAVVNWRTERVEKNLNTTRQIVLQLYHHWGSLLCLSIQTQSLQYQKNREKWAKKMKKYSCCQLVASFSDRATFLLKHWIFCHSFFLFCHHFVTVFSLLPVEVLFHLSCVNHFSSRFRPVLSHFLIAIRVFNQFYSILSIEEPIALWTWLTFVDWSHNVNEEQFDIDSELFRIALFTSALRNNFSWPLFYSRWKSETINAWTYKYR